MAGIAFALAGSHHLDFVGPCFPVLALEANPLGAGVGSDAPIVRALVPAPPPNAPNGIREEMSWHTLTRANQLLDWLHAATHPVRYVPGGSQLSATELACTSHRQRLQTSSAPEFRLVGAVIPQIAANVSVLVNDFGGVVFQGSPSFREAHSAPDQQGTEAGDDQVGLEVPHV